MLARHSLVALLLLLPVVGCGSAQTAPAEKQGRILHAAVTLPNADAAPTDVTATVPGVGSFTTAGPPEGTLVVSHDAAARTAKLDLEVRLADGQVVQGDMVTFTFMHAGSKQEASVLHTTR